MTNVIQKQTQGLYKFVSLSLITWVFCSFTNLWNPCMLL